MEPLSGMTLSLAAYRNLLRDNEKYRSSMLLVQVAIPLHSSGGHLMHAEYVELVKKEAAAIERDFPGSLLMCYEKLPFAPRCALLLVFRVRRRDLLRANSDYVCIQVRLVFRVRRPCHGIGAARPLAGAL